MLMPLNFKFPKKIPQNDVTQMHKIVKIVKDMAFTRAREMFFLFYRVFGINKQNHNKRYNLYLNKRKTPFKEEKTGKNGI